MRADAERKRAEEAGMERGEEGMRKAAEEKDKTEEAEGVARPAGDTEARTSAEHKGTEVQKKKLIELKGEKKDNVKKERNTSVDWWKRIRNMLA